MSAKRMVKATLVRVCATVVLVVGANLALMQANEEMQKPMPPVGTVGSRLAIFAPAIQTVLLTAGLFGLLLGLASLIEKPSESGPERPASPTPDLQTPLVELSTVLGNLHHWLAEEGRTTASGSPATASSTAHGNIDSVTNRRMIDLLEDIRELTMMSATERHARHLQHLQQLKNQRLEQVRQHLRREEWSEADHLLNKLLPDFPSDSEIIQAKHELEQGRSSAEAEALGRVRSAVEDLMAVASWDQAYATAQSFFQNYPSNMEGRKLLDRVARERDVYRESTVHRMYEQIKKDIEHRNWRKGLASAQRLLELFPDHHKTLKIRQQLRLIQDNAEVEERQEEESRIQQFIKSKRFDEAITMGEELIRRFPLSPQADAIEEMLPKLRELAIQREAARL